MWCNLILIHNYTDRDIRRDAYTDFAELAGVKFIKLEHKMGAVGGLYFQRGFQRVDVFVEKGDNQQTVYRAEPSHFRNGEDCDGNRHAVWEPNKITGIQEALIPDTKFNRKLLASHYYHGSMWRIVDSKLDEEIKKWADELEKNEVKVQQEKDNANELLIAFQAEQAKNEELKGKVAELERLNKGINSTRKSEPKTDSKPTPDVSFPDNILQPDKPRRGRPPKVEANADNARVD